MSATPWSAIFKILYKNTQQKEAFDIQYKFLHLAQPTMQKLAEFTHQKTDLKCPRCRRVTETHEHWLYYCPSSQNIFSYVLNMLENIYFNKAPFDNTLAQCLLTPLQIPYDSMPALREVYETYYISIRQIRKDASYGIYYKEETEVEIFLNNLAERLGYLYQKATLLKDQENFFKTWGQYINKAGKITFPRGGIIHYRDKL